MSKNIKTMNKIGITGGLLTNKSILNPAMGHGKVAFASTNAREAAAKIGLQSLYANPKEVLEKYKDFDIVKAMKDQSGSKLLWVRARAIDADKVNSNGDYFSEKALLEEVDFKDGKVPAYKTFEGVPIYSNHKNDDIELAKGVVVHAEWDDKEKCVYCTFFIDEEAYPDIARGIRHGIIHDVSMGTSVEEGECSICGNIATSERDWCLTEDSLITMSDGSVMPIKDVKIGDSVLTHTGEYKKVIEISKRLTKEEMVILDAPGMIAPLHATSRHPIFSQSRKSLECLRDFRQICKPGAVGICYSGKKISGGVQTCVTNSNTSTFEWVESGELEMGDYVQVVKTPEGTGINNNLAKFIGYYLAEGSIEGNKITFSLHEDEKETIVRDLINLSKNLPGEFNSKYDWKIYGQKDSKGIRVKWANKALAEYLKIHCPGTAKAKKISGEIFNKLNKDNIISLISAMIDGDGYQNSKRNSIYIYTSSTDLCNQILCLLSRINVKSSTLLRTQSGGPANRSKQTTIWQIAIRSSELRDFFGHVRKLTFITDRKNTNYIKNELGYGIPINKLENYLFDGYVYNLEVEDDHSFVANGIVVHNCNHLKKYKGKKDPETGKPVFEKNYGLKFIELSVVGDGAFDTCEVEMLFDTDDLIQHAGTLEKKALGIHQSILMAASNLPTDAVPKYEMEKCLRQIASTTNSLVKIAQTAGNLVGGDLLNLGTGAQNATVTNVLKFLGIDAASGLNILDLLNLSLNFLEVAVMNLFARKDNIDLGHVSKISKAMAELQSTMQDLIDDGMGQGAPGGQPTMPQGQAPAAPAQTIEPAPTPAGVGQVVSPQATNVQPQTQAPAGFGGGIAEQSQIFAKTLNSLKNIKIALSKGNEQDIHNNDYIGGKIMSFIKDLTFAFNTENNTYSAQSDNGLRISISSNGNVTAYKNGAESPLAPTLTEQDKNLIMSGDLKGAATNVLKRFNKIAGDVDDLDNFEFSDEDEDTSVLQKVNNLDKKEPEKHINLRLQEQRSFENDGEPQVTLENRTRPLRRNDYSKTYEQKLSEPSWTSRKGNEIELKEQLLEVARRGVDERVIEKKLDEWRKSENKTVNNIEKIISAFTNAAIKNGMHPHEVIAIAQDLQEEGPDAISLSKLNKDNDLSTPALDQSGEKAVADSLADQTDETTTPGDIFEAMKSVLDNMDSAIKVLQTAVDEAKGGEGVTPKIEDAVPTDNEQISADLATSADGSPSDPNQQDVQAALSSAANTVDQLGIPSDNLIKALSGVNIKTAQKNIELAKYPSMREARQRNKKRIDYYGFNKKASNNDILRTLFGELADYATDYGLRSKNLAQAISVFSKTPTFTKTLIAQALSEKKNIRTAGVSVTDSQSNEKTITFRPEDIDVDIKSPDLESKVREKVVEVLTKSGYHVDPNTFSMNEVNVSADGTISVRVFTRFNRNYNVETDSAQDLGIDDLDGEDGVKITGDINQDRVISDMPEETNPQHYGTDEITRVNESNPVMAGKLQKLQRTAQALSPMPAAGGMAPGGPQQAGMMPPGPTTDPNLPDMSNMQDQPGAASFSTGDTDPTAAGDMGAEPTGPGDVMPGVIKPWGTICPQCQSLNVEIAGGEGKCNDCGAQLRYEFTVHVAPPSKDQQYKGTFDYQSNKEGEGELNKADMPEGPEAGLGAATGGETPGLGEAPPAAPPAPMPPQGGPMGAGAPGMAPTAGREVRMFKVSYITDPDVFVNANDPGVRTASRTILPVGFTCPVCASRNVDKEANTSFCRDCNKLMSFSTEPMYSDETKLISSIAWFV